MEKNNNQADLPCNMALMTHSQPQQCPDNNCPWRARYEELSKSNGTYLDEIQAKTEDVFNQAEAKNAEWQSQVENLKLSLEAGNRSLTRQNGTLRQEKTALIEQLQESRDAAQRQRENHARTKQELDAKCASLEESLGRKESEIQLVNNKVLHLQARCDMMEKQLRSSDEQNIFLGEKMHLNHAAYLSEVDALTTKVSELKCHFIAMKIKSETMDKEIRLFEAENVSLGNKLSSNHMSYQCYVNDLTKEIGELNAQLGIVKSNSELMTTQIRLQEEAKEVLGQVMENKETVHREEVGMLTQKIEKLTEKLAKLEPKAGLEDLQEKLIAKDKEYSELLGIMRQHHVTYLHELMVVNKKVAIYKKLIHKLRTKLEPKESLKHPPEESSKHSTPAAAVSDVSSTSTTPASPEKPSTSESIVRRYGNITVEKIEEFRAMLDHAEKLLEELEPCQCDPEPK